jgi:hypothetical protein
VITIWWADAATGTIPNLLIVTALLATRSPPAGTITGPDVATRQRGQASSPTATG